MKGIRRLGALVVGLAAAAAVTLGVAHAASTAVPVNTAPPTITGTPQVGQALTAGNGTWTNTPTSFAYQWLRCNANGRLCAAIPGATTGSYAVTAADAGQALVVSVQAVTTGGVQAALSTLVVAVA